MFIDQKKCKICSAEGEVVTNLKFENQEIINFFTSVYNKQISNFLKKKIGKKRFILKKCSHCQFIWQSNTPKNLFLKQLYDKIIDPKESFKKSKKTSLETIKNYQREITFIQNFHDKKNLNILDFGAGWGTWLLAIKKQCPNIFALELSSSRRKFLKNKKIKLVNLNNTSNYKSFFHVIKLEQVLEHVANLDRVILNLKKILIKGGILSIGVPNGKKEINKNVITIKKGPIQPLEHLNCFNNKSLKLCLKKNGFRPISLFEIIITFVKMKKYIYQNIYFVLRTIKNSIFTTRIHFVKK